MTARFSIGYVRVESNRAWTGGGGVNIDAPNLDAALLEACKRYPRAEQYPYAQPAPSLAEIAAGSLDRGLVLARAFPKGARVRKEYLSWPVYSGQESFGLRISTCPRCGCTVDGTGAHSCKPILPVLTALPMCGECAMWRPMNAERAHASYGRCALTDGSQLRAVADRCEHFVAHWTPLERPKAAPPPPDLQLALI